MPPLENSIVSAQHSKKGRRTSKQKHKDDAQKRIVQKKETEAIKMATTWIDKTRKLAAGDPKKKSQKEIVRQTNELMGTNISDKTVSRMVREGRIGTSPMKRGPVGDFNKPVMNALKGAYSTFLKLEQAESKRQSTLNELAIRVNTLVNSTGVYKKTGNDLARKLKAATADEFDIDSQNTQEHRRLQWTTHANLKAWFDQWKDTLIELGFAREKKADGSEDLHYEGSLVFFPGQLRRILNIDETDGSMDNTNGKRGGRKPMVFYAPDVAGGGTQASKTSYSPTIICGSNAAGEALPAHFQLKTSATESEREKLNIEFVGNCHDVWGQFGHTERKLLPCTYGMNERAGMNAVELDKYFEKAVLPLYPDIEDVPLKRVVAKLDSGPGRLNQPMLAGLKLRGLYMVPGVPNTTSKTQETDQNYGPFKYNYRCNLSMLARNRFKAKKTLTINDLPLLVFGGRDSMTGGTFMANSFELAFNKQSCLKAWKKCGAVPLTMSPLSDPRVRHEVVYNGLQVNTDLDPEAHKLLAIERINNMHCDFLCGFGFDGSQLRKQAPTVSGRKFKLTEPHSKERIEALQKAKTAGQLFHATHGEHLNSIDFFKARAKSNRDMEIKRLEALKKATLKTEIYRQKALAVLQAKGEPTVATIGNYTKEDLKDLLRWRSGKTSTANKTELLEAYLSCTRIAIPPAWSEANEAELQALKNTEIEFKDTALAVSLKQKAKAVVNNIDELDETEVKNLMQALINRSAANPDSSSEGGNII